ncbi:hypothetical protein CYY_005041 [Polysphondylium violaceum]|uniref:ATP-dependent DNA helicase PIF1 n=1 Tax=Polysphondylium violaceum TaxID=133409 RepID=A0A8J4PUE9_9MYCE|nr:hypothetical protein CYY_005041 [Polysphondylium violaceum]
MLLFKGRGLTQPLPTFYHCYSSCSPTAGIYSLHKDEIKFNFVDRKEERGYISIISCPNNLFSRLENNNITPPFHRGYNSRTNNNNNNNNNNIKRKNNNNVVFNRNFVHGNKNRSFLTNQFNKITSLTTTIASTATPTIYSRTYSTNSSSLNDYNHNDSNYEGDDDYFFDFDIDLNINNNGSTNSNSTNNSSSISDSFTTPVNNNKSSGVYVEQMIRYLVDPWPKTINKKSNKTVNKSTSNTKSSSKKIRVTSKNSEKLKSTTTTINNKPVNNNNNQQQKQQEQSLNTSPSPSTSTSVSTTNQEITFGQDENLSNQENDDQEYFDDQNVFELEHKLTKEQQKIVNLIVEGGKNVFFTGSAGTGKSFVLKHLVSKLRKKHPKSVFVTAATGIAAVNIGGTTLHSFGGIKLGVAPAQRLAVEILQSKKALQKWLDCRVLIVDEVSMIDSELFEKLDTVAQIVRENNQPFGGIQLVLVGDFFQLPPVYGNYAFESKAWKKSIDICLELTTVMRQRDLEFIDVLNNLRVGEKNDKIVNFLLDRCKRPLDVTNGVLPTKLYSTNASVDEENSAALEQLASEPHSFLAYDTGSKELLENLDRDCPAMQKLTLKVGAQVVLLRKLEKHDGLVNGSRGVVIDFVKVRSKKRFSKFYESNPMAPVVLFNDGQKVTIPPSEWGVWSEKKASRVQLPLKLAWALTIHKAQGMTLDKVECELSNSFAHGQSYVALSRVKSLEGLHLKDLRISAIKTSEKAKTFNKKFIRSIHNIKK